MSEREHETKQGGWIGVDLDGTLAHYDGWKGPQHIGEPVPEMVRKVKAWLAEGREVRIFTARVYPLPVIDAAKVPTSDSFSKLSDQEIQAWQSIAFIREWCVAHIGQVLSITCQKDFGMVELYDDRCVYVFPNQGVTHREHQGALQSALLKVAMAFGVQITDGMNFGDVADQLAQRTKAATPKADAIETAAALVDGAVDALRYVRPEEKNADWQRASANILRALALLKELAGEK